MPDPVLVTVLRHGEVQGRAHVFRGDLDAPLTAKGRAQMRSALTAMTAPGRTPFDQIATSPRQRCLAFASDWAQANGLPLQCLQGFREMAFGRWEGMTLEEAEQDDPVAYAAFRQSAGETPAPGGESLIQLHTRVSQTWATWLADASGGHRLLITHAGVMRVLLMTLLDLPGSHAYRIALPESAHFQVSLLTGHAPVLLNLNGLQP